MQEQRQVISSYAKDPDQRDYYHVGVVRSVNPLRIVHCTSPGGSCCSGNEGIKYFIQRGSNLAGFSFMLEPDRREDQTR